MLSQPCANTRKNERSYLKQLSEQLHGFPYSRKFGLVVISEYGHHDELYVGIFGVVEYVQNRAAVVARVCSQRRGRKKPPDLALERVYGLEDAFHDYYSPILGPRGIHDDLYLLRSIG